MGTIFEYPASLPKMLTELYFFSDLTEDAVERAIPGQVVVGSIPTTGIP